MKKHLTTLTITTYTPEKYVVLDTETGDLWQGLQGPDNPKQGTWKRFTGFKNFFGKDA